MESGIGNSALVFTPAGAYMESSNAIALKVAHSLSPTIEKDQFRFCSDAASAPAPAGGGRRF
jgi:hypothetical protein